MRIERLGYKFARCLSLAVFGLSSACGSSRADDAVKDIPRVDVHTHCGNRARMAEYMEIAQSLESQYGQRLVAWVDPTTCDRAATSRRKTTCEPPNRNISTGSCPV